MVSIEEAIFPEYPDLGFTCPQDMGICFLYRYQQDAGVMLEGNAPGGSVEYDACTQAPGDTCTPTDNEDVDYSLRAYVVTGICALTMTGCETAVQYYRSRHCPVYQLRCLPLHPPVLRFNSGSAPTFGNMPNYVNIPETEAAGTDIFMATATHQSMVSANIWNEAVPLIFTIDPPMAEFTITSGVGADNGEGIVDLKERRAEGKQVNILKAKATARSLYILYSSCTVLNGFCTLLFSGFIPFKTTYCLFTDVCL